MWGDIHKRWEDTNTVSMEVGIFSFLAKRKTVHRLFPMIWLCRKRSESKWTFNASTFSEILFLQILNLDSFVSFCMPLIYSTAVRTVPYNIVWISGTKSLWSLTFMQSRMSKYELPHPALNVIHHVSKHWHNKIVLKEALADSQVFMLRIIVISKNSSVCHADSETTENVPRSLCEAFNSRKGVKCKI